MAWKGNTIYVILNQLFQLIPIKMFGLVLIKENIYFSTRRKCAEQIHSFKMRKKYFSWLFHQYKSLFILHVPKSTNILNTTIDCEYYLQAIFQLLTTMEMVKCNDKIKAKN